MIKNVHFVRITSSVLAMGQGMPGKPFVNSTGFISFMELASPPST
ncbi:hypothetical protein [Bacillus paranthracis]|nr:hypothetical protein [Bacillus paranthracis]MCU5171703.1 hypothetical protein [Bacillus paranthracis]